MGIEVVDLVWKGLRHLTGGTDLQFYKTIEVVDLVWKGLRHDVGGVASGAPVN